MSDETRLKLLVLLLDKDYCVGALAKKLDISKSAISQHLKVLREAELVIGEKRGYWVHYSVKEDQLDKITKKLNNLSEYYSFECTGCCKHNEK
ncbi:ArsR/SmtB family transcription factor [Selenihalanaerobacter shriftii]|uniref:ArsR/SmtB family transcription factor n=1 Tax=Selenihalanaerobacter shriftii TaxID=142842 RepID=UPI001F4521EA|nr:metalloregulator ArsR/SmtB family transcription factor [Selenihalanaerobacter shriftii]